MVGGNAHLPQPLADGFHQHDVGGHTAPAEAIHLQSHDFPGPHHLAPGCGGSIDAVKRLHGVVQQLQQPITIDARSLA